jgi:hypothetical protein
VIYGAATLYTSATLQNSSSWVEKLSHRSERENHLKMNLHD